MSWHEDVVKGLGINRRQHRDGEVSLTAGGTTSRGSSDEEAGRKLGADITAGLLARIDILEGRVARLDADRREIILDWLRIDPADLCKRCHGRGRRNYGSGTTWRGGIGGQVVTEDVCDSCWGTGDSTRKGADLRKMTREIERLESALRKAHRAGKTT